MRTNQSSPGDVSWNKSRGKEHMTCSRETVDSHAEGANLPHGVCFLFFCVAGAVVVSVGHTVRPCKTFWSCCSQVDERQNSLLPSHCEIKYTQTYARRNRQWSGPWNRWVISGVLLRRTTVTVFNVHNFESFLKTGLTWPYDRNMGKGCCKNKFRRMYLMFTFFGLCLTNHFQLGLCDRYIGSGIL